MGKKNKDQEPNLSSVANRDIIQRINFLYQASTYLSTISQTPSPVGESSISKGKGKRKKNVIRHPRNMSELSRSYVGSMRIVGQKTMVRMDPSIKRTLCKQCDTVLIPGTTATVRVKPLDSHGHAVVYTCLSCRTTRRIPAPPVLDPDAPRSSTAGQEQRDDSSGGATITHDAVAQDRMNIDQQPPASSRPVGSKQGNKRAIQPRLPPLFERTGHVVFRGTEVIEDPQADS